MLLEEALFGHQLVGCVGDRDIAGLFAPPSLGFGLGNEVDEGGSRSVFLICLALEDPEGRAADIGIVGFDASLVGLEGSAPVELGLGLDAGMGGR